MSKKPNKKPQKGFVLKAPPVVVPAGAVLPPPSPLKELQVSDNLWHKVLYWFLCFTFVALPFNLAPGGMSPYNKAYFIIVMVAAVSFIFLTVAVSKKAIALIYSPFLPALGLWLLAKIITTATSIAPAKSFWGAYNSWSDSLVYGLSVALILVIILTLYWDGARIIRLLKLLVAQIAVLSALTIGQAVEAGFFYQKVRPDSPLLNSDFFLSYALLFVPLIAMLFIWQVKKRAWWTACLYGFCALAVSGALFVTLPTHLQTLLLPPLLNGKKDTTYGATDRKSIGVNNFTQTNANQERWTEWKIGLALGLERPLVGTGPGTTGQAFIQSKNQLDLKGWDNSHVMNRSHNELIEQFSQEGLLGLISYILLWGVFAGILVRNWRRIETPLRPYAWGLLGGLGLWLVFNMLLFTTVEAGLLAWVWIALLLTLVKSPREVASSRGRLAGHCALIGLSAAMTIIGFWALRYYLADAAVARAMTINSGLANGAYQNLSAEQRVNLRLQAESDITGAADDISIEDYYANQAALTSINTSFAVKFPDPAETKQRTDHAVHYARQAVKADPHSPDNLQTLGGIEYYLAPSGSEAERRGIALIDQAIQLTPKSVAWYLNAAQIAILKKDYTLAKSYIQRGLAMTPNETGHAQLEKLGQSIP